MPSILAGSLINIFLFAWLFTITEDTPENSLDRDDALWHCLVTCTTVGYGDVSLDTQKSKGLAVIHIVLSVSWLAHLVEVVFATFQKRRYDLQRVKSLKLQLSEDLIKQLDYKENNQIDETEFVMG